MEEKHDATTPEQNAPEEQPRQDEPPAPESAPQHTAEPEAGDAADAQGGEEALPPQPGQDTIDGAPLLDHDRLCSIIESLIFVSGKVLSLDRIHQVVGQDVPREAIRAALDDLVAQHAGGQRGFVLMEVSGGYQFRSNPENADWIGRLFEVKPTRLSLAALEVLSIVAYRQPITKVEVEELRGVDSSGVIKLLLERRLIKSIGHKEEPGRPRLYGTTPQFLEFFNLRGIRDLPPLREYQELTAESRARLDDLLTKGVKVKPHRADDFDEDSYAAGSVTPADYKPEGGGEDGADE